MQGRTTFVIAHRLSTSRRADQILVVENGSVVERGTHEVLYAMEGRYHELYTKQHGVETNLFPAPSEAEVMEAAACGCCAPAGNNGASASDCCGSDAELDVLELLHDHSA